MGTITDIQSARRKRAARRFCTECKTPWSLTAVRNDQVFMVVCKRCGHVRAKIPRQQRTAVVNSLAAVARRSARAR